MSTPLQIGSLSSRPVNKDGLASKACENNRYNVRVLLPDIEKMKYYRSSNFYLLPDLIFMNFLRSIAAYYSILNEKYHGLLRL